MLYYISFVFSYLSELLFSGFFFRMNKILPWNTNVTIMKTKQCIHSSLSLACVASVSVGLVLPARKMVREPKRGKRGRGRGRKETLADKPLDFENRLLDLSCLSAHTKISCCRRLSELSRTCQDMSKTRNGEISMNPSDQCSFWNWNFKIKFNPSKSKNFKGEVLAVICQSGNTLQILIGVWNPCDRKIRNLARILGHRINTG